MKSLRSSACACPLECTSFISSAPCFWSSNSISFLLSIFICVGITVHEKIIVSNLSNMNLNFCLVIFPRTECGSPWWPVHIIMYSSLCLAIWASFLFMSFPYFPISIPLRLIYPRFSAASVYLLKLLPRNAIFLFVFLANSSMDLNREICVENVLMTIVPFDLLRFLKIFYSSSFACDSEWPRPGVLAYRDSIISAFTFSNSFSLSIFVLFPKVGVSSSLKSFA